MVPRPGSILSSKYRSNLAPKTPSNDRSGDNFVSNLNAASLPLLTSDVASLSDSCPLNLPGSNIPDCSVGHDVPSSDSHSPVHKDDIVIAYVFLELHFISLITHSIRVMGPTGAGKSSVSHSSSDAILHWG